METRGVQEVCRYHVLVGERAGEQIDARLLLVGTQPGGRAAVPLDDTTPQSRLLRVLLARRAFACDSSVNGARERMTEHVVTGSVERLLEPWRRCAHVNVAALRSWIEADLLLRLGYREACVPLAEEAMVRWTSDGNPAAAGHAALLLGDALGPGTAAWSGDESHAQRFTLPLRQPLGASEATAAYQQAATLFASAGDQEAAVQAGIRLDLMGHTSATPPPACSPLTALLLQALPGRSRPAVDRQVAPDAELLRLAASRSYSMVASVADVLRGRASRALLAGARELFRGCLDIADAIDAVLDAPFGRCATRLLRARATGGGMLDGVLSERIDEARAAWSQAERRVRRQAGGDPRLVTALRAHDEALCRIESTLRAPARTRLAPRLGLS